MRSPREIKFRLRQETANALLALSSPNLTLAADKPLPLLPDPKVVAQTVGDSEYAKQVIGTAEEILQGRVSIFDKLIEYGPKVAWRRDPLQGAETPKNYFRRLPYLDAAAVGDHKFIWEINRHQHLVLLAQADVISGREEFRQHVFRQLEDWWKENPFQRGINWTSALEVAFRAFSWIWIWHLLDAEMSEPFQRRFLAELYRHGLHLEYNLSIYFSPNTHLLGEAVVLNALARLFPKFPHTARWRALGGDIVRKHMDTCVKPDGSYFDQSTYYHVYALDMFAFHAVIEEVPDSYREGMVRMSEFLASIVSDIGDLPFLGDDDGGRFFHPFGPRPRFARASLAVSSILTGKRFSLYEDRDLAEIAMWWLGPERCATQLQPARHRQSRVFPNTGLVVMRNGPLVALFDAGPFGPGNAGHSHSDTLSLVVSIGDLEVLIDSGTFNYIDPEWRAYFRGSAAHNTIRIDGCDQAVPAGPFRWTKKPVVEHLPQETCDQSNHAAAGCAYRPFFHQRRVEFSQDRFQIADEIEGPPGEHDIEQFWHFAVEPRELSQGRWAVGDVAEFSAESGIVEQSWRSRCFGTKEPAWTIVVRRRAELPLTLHAWLYIRS